MRIVKKEKMDVKKFMEEMKATRTNRSYTSLQPKIRQQTNEESNQERNYASRPPMAEASDHYRPNNPQPLRYNFDQGIRYAPYNPTPYPPRIMTEFAQSQHYAASPPYQQHPSMLNYSQSFNSQLAYPIMQDSARYQQNYGGEMGSMGYSQIRGVSSKLSLNNQTNPQSFQPKMTNSLQEINHHSTSASKPRPASLQPVKKSTTISNQIPNVQPKEEVAKEQVMEKEKPLPEPQKKKRKPKEKKKNPEIIEKNEEVKPAEKEKVEYLIEVEQELKTLSISKKFQQILAEERRKIEDKLRHEKIFKEIMALLNRDIEEIMRRHFKPDIVEKLKDFGEYLASSGEQFDAKDYTYEQELNEFETGMLRKMANLG